MHTKSRMCCTQSKLRNMGDMLSIQLANYLPELEAHQVKPREEGN